MAETFVLPARALLANVSAPSAGALYEQVGALWANAQTEIEALSGQEAVKVPEGSSLDDEIKECIMTKIESLWSEYKPRLADKPIQKRITSMEKHAIEAKARARAAAAANRAAAELLKKPSFVPLTPGAPLGPDSIENKQEPDLIDSLLARSGGADIATKEAHQPEQPGNGEATGAWRAGPVSPPLMRATHRLVAVGTPPLRVTRHGPELAQRMLQNQETFTLWTEAKTLAGAQLREAMTIARCLDLSVHSFGPGYLTSDPAEVQLRRLLSIVLAAKSGSFKLASVLEELPTDGMLSDIPESMVTSLLDRLKIEQRLEGYLK